MRVVPFESGEDREKRKGAENPVDRFESAAPCAWRDVGWYVLSYGEGPKPAVGFYGGCRDRDIPALVPMMRRHIFVAVRGAGLPTQGIGLRLYIRFFSTFDFHDDNPFSLSCGELVAGSLVRFHCEVKDAQLFEAIQRSIPEMNPATEEGDESTPLIYR